MWLTLSKNSFQNAEFIEKFCPKVVEEEAGDLLNLCRKWLEISYNVCWNNFGSASSITSIWNRIYQFIFSESSTEITEAYESFKIKPNNLTASECKDLNDMILKSFLEGHEDACYNEGVCYAQSSNQEGDAIWIRDFLLFINFCIIFAWFITSLIFKQPTPEQFETLQEAAENQQALEVYNVAHEQPLDDALLTDSNGSGEVESSEEETTESLSEKIVEEKKENISERPKPSFDFIDFEELESLIEDTAEDMMITKSDESLRELLVEMDDQQGQVNDFLFDTTVFENSPRTKKPPPNFIQKNIEMVLQKSESLHSSSSRSAPTTPVKNRKSLIPVRATDVKILDHESSC